MADGDEAAGLQAAGGRMEGQRDGGVEGERGGLVHTEFYSSSSEC